MVRLVDHVAGLTALPTAPTTGDSLYAIRGGSPYKISGSEVGGVAAAGLDPGDYVLRVGPNGAVWVSAFPSIVDIDPATDETGAANGDGVGARAYVPAINPVTYAITAQSTAGAFAIDSTSGVVTVLDGDLLDYETSPTETITVRATDTVTLATVDVTYTIQIDDDVTEPPTLPSPTWVPASLASAQSGITTGDWNGATDGTWFIDFTTNYDSSVAPNGQYALYAFTGSNQYILYNRSGNWGCYVENATVDVFVASSLSAVATDRIRCAIRLKNNDFAIAFNGTVTSTDNSGGVPSVGSLSIGVGDFWGTFHAIEYYADPLSNAQLELLTTPP